MTRFRRVFQHLGILLNLIRARDGSGAWYTHVTHGLYDLCDGHGDGVDGVSAVYLGCGGCWLTPEGSHEGDTSSQRWRVCDSVMYGFQTREVKKSVLRDGSKQKISIFQQCYKSPWKSCQMLSSATDSQVLRCWDSEADDMFEDLRATDKCGLLVSWKLSTFSFDCFPCGLLWLPQRHELSLTRMKAPERSIGSYFRRWLSVPRTSTSVAPLQLHSSTLTSSHVTCRGVEVRQSQAVRDIRDLGDPVTNRVRRGAPTGTTWVVAEAVEVTRCFLGRSRLLELIRRIAGYRAGWRVCVLRSRVGEAGEEGEECEAGGPGRRGRRGWRGRVSRELGKIVEGKAGCCCSGPPTTRHLDHLGSSRGKGGQVVLWSMAPKEPLRISVYALAFRVRRSTNPSKCVQLEDKGIEGTYTRSDKFCTSRPHPSWVWAATIQCTFRQKQVLEVLASVVETESINVGGKNLVLRIQFARSGKRIKQQTDWKAGTSLSPHYVPICCYGGIVLVIERHHRGLMYLSVNKSFEEMRHLIFKRRCSRVIGFWDSSAGRRYNVYLYW